LTPTLGIPWHCCGVLKPQCEGKANSSVSRRKSSVLLSGSRPQITFLKILMEQTVVMVFLAEIEVHVQFSVFPKDSY